MTSVKTQYFAFQREKNHNMDIDMAEKFKGKYRIESTRLQNWDYGSNGYYFITICTKNRIPYFGEIVNGEMNLSQIGEYAQKYWLEIPQHFPFVRLDEFIVMPNHIHGIIVIDKQMEETQDVVSPQINKNKLNQNIENQNVETQNIASLRIPEKHKFNKNEFGPQSQNLASIIRGYKIGVTKSAREIYPIFAWQSRFHDRIIRDEKEYYRIANYIKQNPAKWEEEKYNE